MQYIQEWCKEIDIRHQFKWERRHWTQFTVSVFLDSWDSQMRKLKSYCNQKEDKDLPAPLVEAERRSRCRGPIYPAVPRLPNGIYFVFIPSGWNSCTWGAKFTPWNVYPVKCLFISISLGPLYFNCTGAHFTGVGMKYRTGVKCCLVLFNWGMPR